MARTFDPELLDFLESRAVGEWTALVWREVLRDADPLRPNQRGARWNPPGVEALYCSLLPETAEAEIDYIVSLQPVPVRKRRKVRLEVELAGVIDLSDLAPLEAFGMDRAGLLGRNVDAPRTVGSAVSWLGYAGLLVPSARHAGTNLVIYANQMAPTDQVELAT